MAGFVGFIEGLLPNYVASFLPSNDMVGGVIVLWCFVVFYVSQWWLRKAGRRWRAVIFPTALIALSLVGLLAGSVMLAKKLPIAIVGEKEKPGVQPTGLAALSNEQLSAAVVNYARRIRNFENTSKMQMDLATADRVHVPPDWQQNPEARAAYSKASQEQMDQQNAIRIKMRGEQELVFRNEYAAQGRELETELKTRLARQGKLSPYGKESERMVLSDSGGFFAGPHPIASCADYLERNARGLVQ